MDEADTIADQVFSEFMAATEPGLRRALVSGFGPEIGREAAAEALEYGWEHWTRVASLKNPAGYLYKVGARLALKKKRSPRVPVLAATSVPPAEPLVEPRLSPALQALSPQQRTAVVLLHGYGWTYAEVATVMGVGRSTVQRHVERSMKKLRAALEVSDAVA